jgi:hypothetical protein
VRKHQAYRLKAEHAVADLGPHSWDAALMGSGVRQDYRSGGETKRDVVALYLRYYYLRTYGFEVNYQHNLNYSYKAPTGLKRDVKTTDLARMTLLWTPAMNVNLHVTYNPKTFNYVFEDQANLYQDGGKSWSVGFEYSF